MIQSSCDEKKDQKRTEAFYERIAHRTHGQPTLNRISARLAVFAPAEADLARVSLCAFCFVTMNVPRPQRMISYCGILPIPGCSLEARCCDTGRE